MSKPHLPHGYTNESWADGAEVRKRYTGVGAEVRMRTELDAIVAMADRVPTASVLEVDQERRLVTFARIDGAHGQELLDDGRGSETMGAAGRTLRRIHGQPAPDGSVFVHGDYGPQNLLFDPRSFEVLAVLDWEFAHRGEAVEDLAWAEWIVRMHHPAEVSTLGALFEGYGQSPSWQQRHAPMIRACRGFRDAAERAGNREGVDLWQARLTTTEAWRA
jgi:aminoglycoside phosphotransferase (APT) family kinase protein